MKENRIALDGFGWGRMLRRVCCSILHELCSIPKIVRCAYALISNSRETLIVCGWAFSKRGKVIPNNWGDDINLSFFSEATGKRVLLYPNSYLSRLIGLKNFSLVGSIIQFAPQRNTVVWGSGLINDKRGFYLPSRRCKILAVRGPLTREWVLSQGLYCPEIYGDPALLLPMFYRPKRVQRFRVGIIPHHADIERGNETVERLLKEDSVRLIKVQGYGNWRDFIDEICSCDFVISASLHGLIVSEAYGVPALWVEFSEHIAGWDFKFKDFYFSIGKYDEEAVLVTNDTKIQDLVEKLTSWRRGVIDIEALLNVCPFPLRQVSTFPRAEYK